MQMRWAQDTFVSGLAQGTDRHYPHISVAYQDSWIDRRSGMLDINNTNGSNNILESITIKNNNNDSANKLTIEYRYKG